MIVSRGLMIDDLPRGQPSLFQKIENLPPYRVGQRSHRFLQSHGSSFVI
jgi:hypothetical protein